MLLTAIARGLGFVAIAFMLTYLGTAVRNRASAFRSFWIYVALAGGLLGAIATVMFTIGTLVGDLGLPRRRRTRSTAPTTSASRRCSSPPS